jgi:hypothetical protein
MKASRSTFGRRSAVRLHSSSTMRPASFGYIRPRSTAPKRQRHPHAATVTK